MVNLGRPTTASLSVIRMVTWLPIFPKNLASRASKILNKEQCHCYLRCKGPSKNWQTDSASSSRNHLKIDPGRCYGFLEKKSARKFACFMSPRSTLNSLIPKISGGPISPGDCLQYRCVPLINCASPYPESELTDFKLHQSHLKRDPVKFKASSRSAYLLRDNHWRVAFQVTSLQAKQKGLMHYLWMMCLNNLNGA